METVSKKAGRPAAFTPKVVKAIGALYPELSSERQVISKCYEIEAISALCESSVVIKGVANVFDPTANVAKSSVLEHLGRMKVESSVADADIRKAAKWLSSRFGSQPSFTARKAVALLRSLRVEVSTRIGMGLPFPIENLLATLHRENAACQ